jgi:hypothetical protein
MQPRPVLGVDAGQFRVQLDGSLVSGRQLGGPIQPWRRRSPRVTPFGCLSRHRELAHVGAPRGRRIHSVPTHAIAQYWSLAHCVKLSDIRTL